MSNSPIDRPCSFCAAEPGSPCNRPRGSRDGFHAARLSPAVRGASFSGSKNLVDSRARGARRGAAKKKARAKKPEPRKGRVFSVWWHVRTKDRCCLFVPNKGISYYAAPITATRARTRRAVLTTPSEIARAVRFMKIANVGPIVIVRVTVRVRA